jgi:hypothetical protein
MGMLHHSTCHFCYCSDVSFGNTILELSANTTKIDGLTPFH